MRTDPIQSAGRPLFDGLDVTLGTPQRHGGLTIYPLLAVERQPALPYHLLAEALAAGLVVIGEVGSGTVPSLLAANRGETDVLIVDGEQLIGAKQNRLTNRSIILAARSDTVIPVSCMEHGRWHFRGHTFRSEEKPRHAPPGVRRHARAVEAQYAASAPAAAQAEVLASAQGVVWNAIADYESKLGVRSETGAMDEIYARHEERLDEWVARFPAVEGQIGILAFLEGRPLGIDAIGCQALYLRLHERFLGGYCLDAIAAGGGVAGAKPRPEPAPAAESEAAARFLAGVSGARRAKAPTVGKGTYRLLSGPAIGGELSDAPEGSPRLVHLSAFPADDARPGNEEEGSYRPAQRPIAPPSRRRRW